jgi:hypothetical protein
MAKYKLLEKAFINQLLLEAGSEVVVPDDVIPGPHMEPMDAAAKAAFKKTGFVNSASLQNEIVDSIAAYGASPAGMKSGINASE